MITKVVQALDLCPFQNSTAVIYMFTSSLEVNGPLLTYLLTYSMEQSPSWEANQ